MVGGLGWVSGVLRCFSVFLGARLIVYIGFI